MPDLWTRSWDLATPPAIKGDDFIATYDNVFCEPDFVVAVVYATDFYMRHNPYHYCFYPGVSIVDFMILPVGATYNSAIGDGPRKINIVSMFGPPGSGAITAGQVWNAVDFVDTSVAGLTIIHLGGQVYIRANANILRCLTQPM